MSKINAYLFILIIFSILFLIQSDEIPKQETEQKNEKEQEQENNDDDNDEYFDEDGERYFRESLKKYLIEKNLLESDQLIQPEEMKKIFLEVVTEGDAESAADYFRFAEKWIEFFQPYDARMRMWFYGNIQI